MSPQRNVLSFNREGRIDLALQIYHLRQFQSLRRAAAAFEVSFITLTRRHNGIVNRLAVTPNGQKLTLTEEQTIIRYILDLDARGFPPRKCEVKDMANNY
jgi:hypothetical protein